MVVWHTSHPSPQMPAVCFTTNKLKKTHVANHLDSLDCVRKGVSVLNLCSKRRTCVLILFGGKVIKLFKVFLHFKKITDATLFCPGLVCAKICLRVLPRRTLISVHVSLREAVNVFVYSVLLFLLIIYAGFYSCRVVYIVQCANKHLSGFMSFFLNDNVLYCSISFRFMSSFYFDTLI